MDYNYKNRDEVPEKYRWDLTKRFSRDEEWTKELEEVKKHLDDLVVYKGRVLENDNLYELLDKYYLFTNRLEHLYAYASLKSDEDLSKNKYSKMVSEIVSIFSEFESKMSFLIPEIIHSKDFNIATLLKKSPKLERFKHILEEIELEKKYTKDEKTEELISILTKDMNHYEILAGTLLNSSIDYGTIKDETGKTIHLNTGNYGKFITSSNRNLRKKAYLKMNKYREQFSDILGKNLIAFMDRHASMAKIRGYNSTKEMDFKKDFVPLEVHEALLKNMERGLPLFKKYHQELKELLKVDKLQIYDLNAPIGKEEKKYTIEEAQDYVYQATKILGADYVKIIKQGFEERWIDYMPYKGKQSGGYCSSTYGCTSNILMSFNGLFDNISTIAHEMGHAVCSEYCFKNNNIEYSGYTLYTAEIASLLNEILLTEYILQNNFSNKEKISVIIEMLKTINGNFFTAIMENELENIVYEKLDHNEVLSTEDLNTIMDELNKKYYGDTIEYSKYTKYMWTRRSHYFIPWYLYKYATCICGATYFASKILKKDESALEAYKNFLKCGLDKFPNDILLENGIDLTKNEIYDELFAYYESLLNKLKELIKAGERNG